MKVSINIVAWNSMKYLPACLKSIFDQTFRDFSLIVVDNASVDETINFLRQNYTHQLTILRNFKNLGFSRAHNQGIEFAGRGQAEFVLIINPDVILAPNFLGELMKEAEKRPEAGSFGGKLLKNPPLPSLLRGDKRGLIDSAGLKIFKSRRVVERGGGDEDVGQYEKIEEAFGISGALALYRLKALEDIKLFSNDFGEYFDEDFFAYKEDVDLAWRLQLAGWKSFYVPRAIAYHYRQASSKEKIGFFEIIRLRKDKSRQINYFSYRNHPLTLFKNDYLSNFLIHFPYILGYELKKFFYILLLEARTLKALIEFFILLPKMRRKRKIIIGQAKVGAGEIRKWFL